MKTGTRPNVRCIAAFLAATWFAGGAISGANAQTLSPYTTEVFVPDGDIGEFIDDGSGDSQEYFVVTDGGNPNFGMIKASADLTRGVFVGLDNDEGAPSNEAGPSGFGDLPGQNTDPTPLRAPTAFNIGRMFISYNPDIDAYFVAFDVTAPALLDPLAGTQPVAFDIDGDGNTCTVSELNPDCTPEHPTQGDDIYRVLMDLDQNGSFDVRVQVVETTASPPGGSVVLTTYDCDGGGPLPPVTRYLSIEPLGAGAIDAVAFADKHLDSDGDGVADPGAVGVGNDVEFMITNVTEGCVGTGCGNDPFLTRNTEPCCLQVRSFSDSNDDTTGCIEGPEDQITLDVSFRCPDMEVIKLVRCVKISGNNFVTTEHARPGERFEFQVTVQNYGNTDLDVAITDVLSCVSPADWSLVSGSCAPAGAFCTDFENALDPGNPATFPVDFGTLAAGDDCATGVVTDSVFTFQVDVGPGAGDPAFCDDDIDCTNVVSVTGETPEIDPIPNDEEEDCADAACCTGIPGCVPGDGTGDVDDEFTATVEDIGNVIDTPRESLPLPDDNVAYIELECRDITFTKEASASNAAGALDPSNLPTDPADYPIDVTYTYGVTNNGELDENVTITDAFLCGDVAAAQAAHPGDVSFVSCPLCPSGSFGCVAPAGGGSCGTSCTIRFDTPDALLAFLAEDDGRLDCPPDPDPAGVFCYRNCATATVSTVDADVCQQDETFSADVVICAGVECNVEVTKRVRCILDDCSNPTSYGPYFDTDPLVVIPGACAEFEITVANTGPVDIPLVCITDTLGCNWFVSGSVEGVIDDGAGGLTPVSNSLAGFVPDGVRRCFVLMADAGGARPLAPGEFLIITFRVQVPGSATTDCENCVVVEGYTTTDDPNPPLPDPTYKCMDDDCADIEVERFGLDCDKTVSIDVDAIDNPGIDFPDTTGITLTDPVFPIDLYYSYTIRNTGTLPINKAQICDNDLVADALAAGLTVVSCDLSDPPDPSVVLPPSCVGATGNVCSPTVSLTVSPDPGATATFTCVLRVPGQTEWDDFAALDPGSGDQCYTNVAQAQGEVDTTDICVPPGFDNAICSTQCPVTVCIAPGVNWPPTKVMFDIWNQWEVKFSETERCIVSWDQTLLSEYTEPGIPNAFLISNLQTLKGKARINAVRSPEVCGDDSVAAPLLGVAAKVLDFFPSQEREMAGMTLVGMGDEAGWIRYDLPTGPLPPPGPGDEGAGTLGKSLVMGVTADTIAKPASGSQPSGLVGLAGETVGDPSGGPSAVPPAPGVLQKRASTSVKGSLLVYTKVEIKWDANGVLVQDTFLDITNDANLAVHVQFYLINGDQPVPAEFDPITGEMIERAHPGCNDVDFVTTLTRDQPQWWSAALGQGSLPPFTAPPFTVLDDAFDANGNGVIDPFERAGRPDPDPLNLGGRMLRGYVLAWAVDSPEGGPEIHWNHLKGDAFIVNYQQTAAWEQNAWSFRAVAEGKVQGDVLLDPLGTLDMNGVEYDWAPAKLLFDFYAAGSTPFISPNRGSATVDTDLTLWMAFTDLRQP